MGEKAVENATKACELTKWKEHSTLDTLAAAHAEAANFDEAVKWQKKAIELGGYMNKEETGKAAQRLKLFEKGQPYRQE